ncbi:MAG: class II D-tagatose-bisphosphate aldolase non-catalytic subunit [Clostridia bacterium]|jgi:D-tagatose-1,6-bisphosphate aldolase subunit GatZ/KbaZ
MHPLLKIIEDRKKGIKSGIVSICSANRYVTEASMNRAKKENTYVLIEATANQVNQFGGYTGMRPADFRDFIFQIADEIGFERERILLGGDHLGPLVWKDLPEEKAMEYSHTLIDQFVSAGFTKIHLDTSMRLKDDDPNAPLETSVIAKRGALLCKTAEEAAKRAGTKPVYVIGSEVPIPGGSQEEEDTVSVTTVESFVNTVETYKKTFSELGLDEAFDRVIGVVVQPGVEFGDETIHPYDREKAALLTAKKAEYPNIVFEGHSTDYQLPELMKQMNEDGIALLKVGPALTFAMREGLFALELIEKALVDPEEQSRFSDILEKVMTEKPDNWKKHYHGDEKQLKIKRKFSYSDRARYYIPDENVSAALSKLLSNLEKVSIPLTCLSQYMPIQYLKVRRGQLKNRPHDLLLDKIDNLLDDYYYAIRPITFEEGAK